MDSSASSANDIFQESFSKWTLALTLLACLGKPNTSSTNILKIRGGCRRIQQLFYSALQGHCVSVLPPERAPTNPPRLEAFKTAALQRCRAIGTRPCRVARIQNALYVYVSVLSTTFGPRISFFGCFICDVYTSRSAIPHESICCHLHPYYLDNSRDGLYIRFES